MTMEKEERNKVKLGALARWDRKCPRKLCPYAFTTEILIWKLLKTFNIINGMQFVWQKMEKPSSKFLSSFRIKPSLYSTYGTFCRRKLSHPQYQLRVHIEQHLNEIPKDNVLCIEANRYYIDRFAHCG